MYNTPLRKINQEAYAHMTTMGWLSEDTTILHIWEDEVDGYVTYYLVVLASDEKGEFTPALTFNRIFKIGDNWQISCDREVILKGYETIHNLHVAPVNRCLPHDPNRNMS